MHPAANKWLDENGITWLETAPKIKLLPENNKKEPYPLSWEERMRLFNLLPSYLAKIAMFRVIRGAEIRKYVDCAGSGKCRSPEFKTSVIIPAQHVKNRQERLSVLNKAASRVVEEMRGALPEFVFVKVGRLKRCVGRHGNQLGKRQVCQRSGFMI